MAEGSTLQRDESTYLSLAAKLTEFAARPRPSCSCSSTPGNMPPR
jgi:hypothetical protein